MRINGGDMAEAELERVLKDVVQPGVHAAGSIAGTCDTENYQGRKDTAWSQ